MDGNTSFKPARLAPLLATAAIFLFAPPAFAQTEWDLSGPFVDDAGIVTCQIVSPQNLGMRFTSTGTHLYALLSVTAKDYPFILGLEEYGPTDGLVQIGMNYAFSAPIQILDARTVDTGREYIIGWTNSNDHLVDAVAGADYLYVLFPEDLPARLFAMRNDDYALRISLDGALDAIHWAIDCTELTYARPHRLNPMPPNPPRRFPPPE